MNINSLARKAAKQPNGGHVQVEDVIRFVLFHGGEAADELERLQAQYQWPLVGELPDGRRMVPLGQWIQVCTEYGRHGLASVEKFLKDKKTASVTVGLLSHVRTAESVNFLLIFSQNSEFNAKTHREASWCEWEALLALNKLLSFDDFVKVNVETKNNFLSVLKRALVKADNTYLQSIVLYALRGASTVDALEWLKTLDVGDGENATLKNQSLRVIQKRLAPNFKSLNVEEKRLLRLEMARDV